MNQKKEDHQTILIDFIQRNRIDELMLQLHDSMLVSFNADDPLMDFIIGHDRNDILSIFLEKFPNLLLSRTQKKNQTLLHLSVSQPSVLVTKLLLTSPSLPKEDLQDFIDAQNNWGETALHLAASSGNDELIGLILMSGAKQDLVDNWGRTAGAVAMDQGYTHLVTKYSLSLGRHFDESDSSNNTLNLKENEQSKEKQQLVAKEFISALSSLQLKHRRLLENHEPNDDIDNALKVKVKTIFGEVEERITVGDSTGVGDISSPVAFLGTSKEEVKQARVGLSKLIEYPPDPDRIASLIFGRETAVDVNGRDMFGLTALHKAASWDTVEIVELLLSHPEIDVNVMVKVGEHKGFTALHFAIDTNSVRVLLRFLQDERICNWITSDADKRFVHLAIQRNFHPDIIAQLQHI
jgi:ankyrin repeat protein